MHILQLVPRLDVGGVERGVLDLARGLIQRGHRVSVVSSGGALVEPLVQLGATHYALSIHHKSPQALWRCVPEVCRIIREEQVDVIHARSRVPAWVGYLASRRIQKPFVTTCHGFYTPHLGSRVMTWGRTVIAPSKLLGRYLIDTFQVPPERLRVIPRGVDLVEFPFRDPAPHGERPWRIGIIGRFSALKGHDVAIRALAQLLRHHPSATLCVIGDAPAGNPQARARLEQLADTLGVAQAIEWLGTRYDIPERLASLDVVVVPSTYPESFGRSVIEAYAVGVPVVASRLGALAEIVEEGVTGLLVEPRDPTALAQAISRLIQEEPLRLAIIQHARRRVEEQFSLEQMVHETEAVYRDCLSKPRIVVWKLSALGDVVLVTPSLRAIRRQFSESPITLVVGRPVYEVVARCPYVDDVVVYDAQRKDRTLRGKRTFLRRLTRGGFDLSIDLQNSRLTHVLAWLAGIPVRIGYARRWGRLLNRRVALPRTRMDPVAHQHYLLEAAQITPDGHALELWPSDLDEQAVEPLLPPDQSDIRKPLVGVHLGSSGRWKTKRWDLERWAALCDRLADQGFQVVVTGSPSDHRLGEQLMRFVRSKPVLAIGKTRIMELACLIRRCAAFVTTDSAPLHIAVAMGVPTVCLFGPTDPARHVPPSSLVRVINKKVFCSPCYSPRCRTITHACMKRITVDEVAQAILEACAARQILNSGKLKVESGKGHGR